jgi:predicted nucleotidyltransferase
MHALEALNPMEVLNPLVEEAKTALGVDLLSVTLFGSGAENRLRKSSDLNLIFVLKTFDHSVVKRFAPKLVFARATYQVDVLWLVESEVAAAVEAFGQKFSDVKRRHRVLFGRDYFAEVTPSREATVFRLRQVLLNAQLRLRDAYVMNIGQPDRLIPVIARYAGPLRSCAATLRELRAEPVLPPKEALEHFLTASGLDATWLPSISAARDNTPLSSADAVTAIEGLMAATERLRLEAEAL